MNRGIHPDLKEYTSRSFVSVLLGKTLAGVGGFFYRQKKIFIPLTLVGMGAIGYSRLGGQHAQRRTRIATPSALPTALPKADGCPVTAKKQVPATSQPTHVQFVEPVRTVTPVPEVWAGKHVKTPVPAPTKKTPSNLSMVPPAPVAPAAAKTQTPAKEAAPQPEKPVAVLSQDEQWKRKVIAAVLVLEAGGEGRNGMHAVMNIIQHRAEEDPQGFYKAATFPGQFVCLNDISHADAVARANDATHRGSWTAAMELVTLAMQKQLSDKIGGATQYCTLSCDPSWKNKCKLSATIGSHNFFTWNTSELARYAVGRVPKRAHTEQPAGLQ